MARTALSDLWVPDIWIPGVAERQRTRLNLLTAIAVSNPLLNEAATGGGDSVQIPFLKEPDFDDEIQVASTAPTVNKVTSARQVAAVCNRVASLGNDALAAGVSGTNQVAFALDAINGVRSRNRQRRLLNTLRGVFGNAAAPGAGAAAFKALRNDIFLEAGNSATSANLFSSDAFIDTCSIFGDAIDKLESGQGAVVMHSTVHAAATKQNDIATIRDSDGKIVMRTYKGAPVFINDILTRAGGTNGSVFETYIFLRGAVSTGDKPQSATVGDLASLLLKEDEDTNDVTIYDRTRSIIHVQGTKWTGSPAGQSATNAELATEGNWSNVLQDNKNAGVICLRTNG